MRDETMPDLHEEGAPNMEEHMQEELHKKGAVLTKAWADLFSYLTKYQAELTVKENTMEIAEKEIHVRKKQLEEMKPVPQDSEEYAKLQDEIHGKERLLTKAQSELTVKEQLLRRTQSDLTCNMEMLERSRSDMLEKQSDLIRYRGDIERLKSQLAIQQEQVSIKDNLLKKLQGQLMKENQELKEQSELDRRAFELERRAHELTKRSLRERAKSGGQFSTNPVIEIPDSPPTLDLSVENADFGLSNIISMTESHTTSSQMMDHSSHRLSHSSGQDSALPRLASSAMSGLQEFSSRLSGMAATSQTQWRTTPPQVSPSHSKFGASQSQTHSSAMSHDTSSMTTSASDVFFPLSVESEDNKGAIDTSAMMTDSDMPSGPVPISGPIPSSMGTSDNSQGGIPMSGMSPGGGVEGGGDGKCQPLNLSTQGPAPTQHAQGIMQVAAMSPLIQTFPGMNRCSFCRKTFSTVCSLKVHLVTHTNQGFKCHLCGKAFYMRAHLDRHLLMHTGERPFSCSVCGKKYRHKHDLKKHKEWEHVE